MSSGLLKTAPDVLISSCFPSLCSAVVWRGLLPWPAFTIHINSGGNISFSLPVATRIFITLIFQYANPIFFVWKPQPVIAAERCVRSERLKPHGVPLCARDGRDPKNAFLHYPDTSHKEGGNPIPTRLAGVV